MTLQDIAQLRLASQHISQANFDTPDQVVKHLLAMQAQDYNGALWSIGLRTKNCTRKDIEQAIIGRKIVRTWPMRGTLHIVHADDIRWLVNLLGPRALAVAAGRRKQLGIDDKVLDHAKTVLVAALEGGVCLTRKELCAILDKYGIESANQRGIHILHYFSETALICFGPHKVKQPTFVLLDEWLLPTPEKTRDEALGELARRYVESHGPVQLKDLIGWAGITATDVKTGLELARAYIETKVVSE